MLELSGPAPRRNAVPTQDIQTRIQTGDRVNAGATGFWVGPEVTGIDPTAQGTGPAHPADGGSVAGVVSQAASMSVRAKSSPLNSNGSREVSASA